MPSRPFGDVAPHAEQRHHARRRRAAAGEERQLRGEVRVAFLVQPAQDELEDRAAVLPEILDGADRVPHPLADRGEPGVLQVEAAGAVDVLDGGGDDRAVVRVQLLVAARCEGQQIAVGRDAVAERGAEAGEAVGVAPQEQLRAERPGREDDARGDRLAQRRPVLRLGDVAGPRGVVDAVAHAPSRAPISAVDRLDRNDVAQGADLGARAACRGQIRVVERVLRPEVAADVALAAAPARAALDAVQRARALERHARLGLRTRCGGEGHGEVDLAPAPAGAVRSLPETARLRRAVRPWVRRRPELGRAASMCSSRSSGPIGQRSSPSSAYHASGRRRRTFA